MSVKRILLIAFILIGYSFAVLSIPLTKVFAYIDMSFGSSYADIENYLYSFPLNFFIIVNLSVAIFSSIFLYIDCTNEKERRKNNKNK